MKKITRKQWLARCAKQFIKVAGIAKSQAVSLANSNLENLNNDLTENPEQAADDEMSYWMPD